MSRPPQTPVTVDGKTYPSETAYIMSPEYQNKLKASFPSLFEQAPGSGGASAVAPSTIGATGTSSAGALAPSTAASHVNPYIQAPSPLTTSVHAQSNAEYRKEVEEQTNRNEAVMKKRKTASSRKRKNKRNSRNQRRH